MFRYTCPSFFCTRAPLTDTEGLSHMVNGPLVPSSIFFLHKHPGGDGTVTKRVLGRWREEGIFAKARARARAFLGFLDLEDF